MRKDDNTMMVVTGLVLAIGVGIFAERMSSGYGGPEVVRGEPVEDRFMLRAGVASELDVLSNDGGLRGDLRVTEAPSCGTARVEADRIIYEGSDNCAGSVEFAYCVGGAEDCAPATVKLSLQARPLETAVVAQPRAQDPTPIQPEPTETAKIDLEPLPRQPVTKPGPEFALIPSDLIEDASLRAFAATLEVPAPMRAITDVLADFDRSAGLDGAAATAGQRQRDGLFLLGHAPDPARAAGFLRSYAEAGDDAPPVVAADVPVLQDVEIAALPPEGRFDVTLPSQRVFPMPEVAEESDTQQIEQVAARFDDEVAPANSCEVNADLNPAPGAHVTLTVSAPCLAGQKIIARSHGLDFLLEVSEEGSLVADLPALDIDVLVTLALGSDVAPIDLRADGSDVLQVERSAFRFSGSHGLTLAAVEVAPGAGIVETTHQDALAHRDAFLAGRGYVRRYPSTDGRVIEVYTLPLSRQVLANVVDMRLTRMGPGSCTGPITLEYLHLGRADDTLQSATLPITACASRNGYALRNVVGSIAVASQ